MRQRRALRQAGRSRRELDVDRVVAAADLSPCRCAAAGMTALDQVDIAQRAAPLQPTPA